MAVCQFMCYFTVHKYLSALYFFSPFLFFALPQNAVYVLFNNVVFLDLFFQLAIISVKGFFLRL